LVYSGPSPPRGGAVIKDDGFYLILEAEDIARIEKFTADGKNAFFVSELIQGAVLRHLKILGESIRRLSVAIRSQYPDIAWRGIVAMRNVLVNDYLEIDLEEIWDIVEKDLPVLKNQIQTMLHDLGGL
jgi:uncharacterized protein with HEPN domain